MYKRRFELFTICFAVVASCAFAADGGENDGRGAASRPAIEANKNTVEENVAKLNAFGHVAYLPSGTKLSSIQFVSVKTVKVRPSRTSDSDARYCESLTEPGGSMYCPVTQYEHPVPAYRVTYSYEGPPLTSDEYGATRFSFSIDFRPEEFVASARSLLSSGKVRRSEAAAMFSVTTSDMPAPSGISESNSSYVMVRVDPARPGGKDAPTLGAGLAKQ